MTTLQMAFLGLLFVAVFAGAMCVLLVAMPDPLRQRPEISVITGCQHHCRGRPGHHVGAHKQNIIQFQRVAGLAVELTGKLLYRHRLARHRRLADK